jgi:ferredoxin
MEADLYERLALHLDDLPAGYPSTESGVEMRILRRLFTPEDAELALHLTLIPEEPRVIAHRAKIPVEEAGRRLADMEKRGLIYSVHRPGRVPKYQIQQFAVGFWEGQVDQLNRELVEDVGEYLPAYLDAWQKGPQLRTIPVGESISTQTEVMAYERAEALVRAKDNFAVANCICRQEQRILDQGCDKPEESCLSFGDAADFVVRNGRGRAISQDEALAILHRAEEVGLVLQPANAKDAVFICTCCGCCCGVLRNLKLHPEPASLVSSPYVASLNTETCQGCGTCVVRCQMDAIHLDDGVAILDLNRCIGCGLCVNTCPTDSFSLLRKPEAEQPFVPRNIVGTNLRLGQARGKLGKGELIGMLAKSALDRLLAPR